MLLYKTIIFLKRFSLILPNLTPAYFSSFIQAYGKIINTTCNFTTILTITLSIFQD